MPKEALPLLSVPVKEGNEFPVGKLAFLHQEAERQLISRDGEFKAEKSV